MKLTVLTENVANDRFLAEHGLSYLVEHDSARLLFDAGNSDVFLQNAARLSIDIDSIDTVVLSHGHWDHGDGLAFLSGKRLICHPNAFAKRYSRLGKEEIGLSLSKEEIISRFDVQSSATPVFITKKIVFLGEIPRLNDFESQSTPFVDENLHEDFIPDDSALAVITENGLVVVSGCAHAGICNTIEHAKAVTGIGTVHAVIGGFHLLRADEQTARTIEYFHRNRVNKLLPSHCTQFPVLARFHAEFGSTQLKTGYVFEF